MYYGYVCFGFVYCCRQTQVVIYFQIQTAEHVAISTPLITLRCDDADTGVRSDLTYHVNHPSFDVVRDNNEQVTLRVNADLDREVLDE